MTVRRSLVSGAAPISALGLGCMGLGGRYERDDLNDVEAIGVIHAALDGGTELLDTAEVYGDGHGEEVVGAALAGRRDQVTLAGKVSPEHLSGTDLAAALEGSLRRLKTDRIDLYQVHWPSASVPMEETAAAMDRALKQGKIRAVGLSNFSLPKLKAYLAVADHPVVSLQVEYNLFDRSIESELLPFCREQGIALIAYSPLDQGRVTGDRQAAATLGELANGLGVSIQQLALAWLLAQDGVFVIPKAGRLKHLTENLAAAEITLSDAVLKTVADVSSSAQRLVPCGDINPLPREGERYGVYQSVDEARENRFNADPSPLELAKEIKAGDMLKLPRVAPSQGTGRPFDLIEGRMRYWGWCLAYGEDSEIPVLVRG